MKALKLAFLGSLLLSLSLSSCVKKAEIETKYEKSLKAWEQFRSSSNNNYVYVTIETPRNYSYTETRLVVKNGQVESRDCRIYDYQIIGDVGSYKLAKEWQETKSTLNTHGSEGAALYSIDEIYAQAQYAWFTQNKDIYDISFETENDGIISKAGYQRKRGCAEGCFIGAVIRSISKL